MKIFLPLIFALFSFSSLAGLPDPVKLLSKYIQINTTNPPGKETKAANFLADIFRNHQIPVQIFDLGKGRANLLATFKGTGELPPIILLHHMDVVPVEKKFWKHDPFKGEIDQGVLYGRGAVDIKGKGIMDLMVLLKLKDAKVKLKRDIYYLAVADEEMTSLGAKWMIKNQKDLLSKAEFLIDEGATVRAKGFYVSIGEKSPLWLSIRFKGKSGHASVPHDDNAVTKAIAAGNKILTMSESEPFRVIPGTEKYIEMNTTDDYKRFPGFRKDFLTSLKDQDFLKAISVVPELNALMRDTITITGMKGSDKTNTIPNEAYLKLDCRLLPGTDKDQFLDKLKTTLGSDAEISIEEYYASTMSPAYGKFFEALKQVAGASPIVPTILTASTDSSLFRKLGIKAYGFEAYSLTEDEIESAHGNEERIPVKSLLKGIDTLYEFLMKLDA